MQSTYSCKTREQAVLFAGCVALLAFAVSSFAHAAAQSSKQRQSLDVFGIPVGQKFEWAACAVEGIPESPYCFQIDKSRGYENSNGYVWYFPLFSQQLPSPFEGHEIHLKVNLATREVDRIRIDFPPLLAKEVLAPFVQKYGRPVMRDGKGWFTLTWKYSDGSKIISAGSDGNELQPMGNAYVEVDSAYAVQEDIRIDREDRAAAATRHAKERRF
jgi:hypothetical protein